MLIHGFDTALPPIVRHDGSIVSFGNRGSTEVPGKLHRGFMNVFDRDGNISRRRNVRQFTVSENTKYSEFGVASAVGTLDVVPDLKISHRISQVV